MYLCAGNFKILITQLLFILFSMYNVTPLIYFNICYMAVLPTAATAAAAAATTTTTTTTTTIPLIN
jgi:hypothetical protein